MQFNINSELFTIKLEKEIDSYGHDHVSQCKIIKVIKLPGAEYRMFRRHLNLEYPFIAEYASEMPYSLDGCINCILVWGEGQNNGIIVNSNGANYPVYTAYIPHVPSFLSSVFYKPLHDFNLKMMEMVDYAIDKALTDQEDGDYLLDLDEMAHKFHISLEFEATVADLFAKMCECRPEIKSAWIVEQDQKQVFDLEISDSYIKTEDKLDENLLQAVKKAASEMAVKTRNYGDHLTYRTEKIHTLYGLDLDDDKIFSVLEKEIASHEGICEIKYCDTDDQYIHVWLEDDYITDKHRYKSLDKYIEFLNTLLDTIITTGLEEVQQKNEKIWRTAYSRFGPQAKVNQNLLYEMLQERPEIESIERMVDVFEIEFDPLFISGM